MPLIECRCGAANNVPYDTDVRCSLCGRNQRTSAPQTAQAAPWDGRPVTIRTGVPIRRWREEMVSLPRDQIAPDEEIIVSRHGVGEVMVHNLISRYDSGIQQRVFRCDCARGIRFRQQDCIGEIEQGAVHVWNRHIDGEIAEANRERRPILSMPTVAFSRVEDPAQWSPLEEEDAPVLKERWIAPDFWLREEVMSPARTVKIPGVKTHRQLYPRWVVKHEDLGKCGSFRRGKIIHVWRDRVTLNTGKKITVDLPESDLVGSSDGPSLRLRHLREELERMYIDIKPLLESMGL